jgi:hypothetical protein
MLFFGAIWMRKLKKDGFMDLFRWKRFCLLLAVLFSWELTSTTW